MTLRAHEKVAMLLMTIIYLTDFMSCICFPVLLKQLVKYDLLVTLPGMEEVNLLKIHLSLASEC